MLRGLLPQNLEDIAARYSAATTCTGLKTKVKVLDRIYETGRKLAREAIQKLKVLRDEVLPKWNYRLAAE